MLPNFLIIGAARCGTTTLYNLLQTHPDVYVPLNKRPEPHFFLKEAEYSQGLPYYEQRFFAGWKGQRAVGEASTSYVYGAEVPRRVAAALPDVKLICLLRNPIERAFSGYWHSVVSGLETLSFEDALAEEHARKIELAGTPLGEIAPFAYVERGLYHQQLNRWLAVFDPARLKVVLLEELLAQPQRMATDIAQFLGINPEEFSLRELKKENTSVPDGATMSHDVYRALAGRFSDDVLALERLLGRDLGHWLVIPNPRALAP